MYLPAVSHHTSFEGILGTKTQQTHRDLQARLDFTEQYQIRLDQSKLCLEVGVRSPRARDVLHDLHRSVFSVGFEERLLRLDEEGFLWASYPFVDPDRL